MDNTKEWEITTTRFVAFFDIMGFKDLVLKTKHEEIVELLEKLSQRRHELHRLNNQFSDDENMKIGETKSFTFSDSIIFFSKTDSLNDLKKIIVDCFFIQREALRLGIPIKGALSHGVITVNTDNSLYFGQPIIEAYILHEELYLYGVIVDHNFEKKAKEILPTDKDWSFEELFSFYGTPLKSGKASHYLAKVTKKDLQIFIGSLQKLYQKVSGKPRQYIDNSIEYYNSLIKDRNPS